MSKKIYDDKGNFLMEIDSKQQPPAGDFTKETRKYLNIICKRTSKDTSWEQFGDIITEITKRLCKACDIIDRTEAINKDLLTALEEIRDLETECCTRCEGNGRLSADGKAHLLSENADTIFCGNCGGSGRILPENAQDIAETAIAKAKKEETK